MFPVRSWASAIRGRPTARLLALAVGAVTLLASPADAAERHRVAEGESLSGIAARYRVPLAFIAARNQIRDVNLIHPGQVLDVTAPGAVTTYRVQPGDTLSEIADRFGVPTSELARHNGLGDVDRIVAGRGLEVRAAPAPPAAAAPPAPARPRSYVVKPGDNLSTVAAIVGTTSEALADLNGIGDPHQVLVGTALRLPGPPPVLPEGLRDHSDRVRLVPVFQRWADEYEIPADLVMAVTWVESGWQADAVSQAGAMGIGQLMPDTVAFMREVLLPGEALDPHDAEDSIQMSARFLRYLLHRTPTDSDAIAAYYRGLASFRRDGIGDETRAYIAAVQAHRPLFRPASESG